MKPTYFKSPDHFRDWLQNNHTTAEELLVGFHKKDSGKPSMTWPESVDEALCFGWIDGIRKSVDENRYTIRFTPRKKGSVWSSVNIKKVQMLIDAGRMQPAGLAAFEKRQENRSGIYSFEQRSVELPEPYREMLQVNKTAWAFFEKQAPSYRKAAIWWVVSAKQEKTRLTRLEKLIAHSANGERIPQFTSKKPPG